MLFLLTGEGPTDNRELLCQVFTEKAVRFEKLDMPSFKAFLTRLEVLLEIPGVVDNPE